MKQYIYLFLLGIASAHAHGQTAIINGDIQHSEKDSVRIVLKLNTITKQVETLSLPITNGHFSGTLQLNAPTYFFTNEGSNYVTGLIEPGDNITLLYDANSPGTSIKFRGKGSEKSAFLFSMTPLRSSKYLTKELPIAKAKAHPFDYLFDYTDSVEKALLHHLDSIKPFMTLASYRLLKADIAATTMANKHESIGIVYHESVDITLQKRANKLTENSKRYLQNILTFDSTLSYSQDYLIAAYDILFRQTSPSLLHGNSIKKYDSLSTRLPSNMRIPILTLFLSQDLIGLNPNSAIDGLKTVIQQTYKDVPGSLYKNFIETKLSNLLYFKKGMNAPDFTLENERGEKVSLSSFKGKIIYLV